MTSMLALLLCSLLSLPLMHCSNWRRVKIGRSLRDSTVSHFAFGADTVPDLLFGPIRRAPVRQSAPAYSMWNGKLVYFHGASELSLEDASEICGSMNGRLPSVHSREDTQAIEEIMGHDARAWLGAETHSKGNRPQSFQWLDGSAWDYELFPTSDHRLPCDADCCGIGYTTVSLYTSGFVIKRCSDKRRMICVLDNLSALLDRFLPSLTDSSYNETMDQHERILTFLTRLNFEQMNRTLDHMKVVIANHRSGDANRSLRSIDLESQATDLRRELTRVRGRLLSRVTQLVRQGANLTTTVRHMKQQLVSAEPVVRAGTSLLNDHELQILKQQTIKIHEWINTCFLLLFINSFLLAIELWTSTIWSHLTSCFHVCQRSN